MDALIQVLDAAWQMLYEAGFFVLVGLLAAGLVHIFVSREWMTRHLGGRGFGAVVKAALIGAPLPLCSCSVLPAAYALREKGASRGATVSFLISTPETGIDSIAVTWALMGPLMAIARPVAAVMTAMVAGFFETLRGRSDPPRAPDPPACEICQSDSCEHVARPGRWSRFWRFVVFEMGDDVGPTLTLGLILAGVLTALIPDGFFETYLGNRWASMLLMLAIGLPLYVCATASTPLAAALVLKGLNPGAALVFLLAGPATNLATILVVGRMLGKLSAAMYVGTIAVMALACGVVLDEIAGAVSVGDAHHHVHEIMPPWIYTVGGIVLGLYLLHAVVRWVARKVASRKAHAPCCAADGAHGGGHGAAKSAAAAGGPCCAGDDAAGCCGEGGEGRGESKGSCCAGEDASPCCGDHPPHPAGRAGPE